MANASTTGFKADRVRCDQLYLIGQGLETRRPTSEEVIDADRNPGTVQQTGRPLDVAMAGDAWLAVQATDGSEAYTRRGDLSIARSEEHTSELQSLMRISYAVFCLKKKKNQKQQPHNTKTY